MHALGHGVDLVSVARIDRLVREHGERFLERCFTRSEREYAAGKARAAEHLAARFAAKEATLKALGCGLTDGIGWTDIEVARAASGQPSLTLTGRAAEVAAARGITEWMLSLSHTDANAIASVIAFGDP